MVVTTGLPRLELTLVLLQFFETETCLNLGTGAMKFLIILMFPNIFRGSCKSSLPIFIWRGMFFGSFTSSLIGVGSRTLFGFLLLEVDSEDDCLFKEGLSLFEVFGLGSFTSSDFILFLYIELSTSCFDLALIKHCFKSLACEPSHPIALKIPLIMFSSTDCFLADWLAMFSMF